MNPNLNSFPTADQVATATKELAPETREAILWLHHYGATQGISQGMLSVKIGASPSTVSRLFSGKYETENFDRITQRIADFRARVELEQQQHKADQFVKTSTATLVWQTCEIARQKQKLMFLWGNSRMGKTTALDAYQQAHAHLDVRKVIMPTGAMVRAFMNELAKVSGHTPKTNFYDLRDRILKHISPETLIIVDEFDVVFTETGKSTMRLATLEFIRELLDRTRCGMVLVGTGEAWERVNTEKAASVVKLRNRAEDEIWLDDVPTEEDLNLIAAKFGFPKLTGEYLAAVTEFANKYKLGRYCAKLDTARTLARMAGRRVTWDDFKAAHDAGLKLAQRKGGAK